MKNNKNQAFKEAVEQTEDVKNCYKTGLQALGNHSKKIEVSDTSKCEGSVEIDRCVESKYPQDNRWDYTLSYKGKVYFVEVHSAETSEVSVVLKKLQWLKDWLNQQAPLIKKLSTDEPYCWIQSGRYNILKGSKQERLLAQKGLKLISKLILQ